MTKDEALKLALDALEAHADFGLKSDKPIAAIKEALAQPEQEPVAGEPLPCPFCGHVGLDFSDGSTYRWGIASCGGCGVSCGEIRREYPDKGEWHGEAIAEWNKRTSPPQRKPLTDEEIWNNDKIMAANSGYGATFDTLRELIQAIEAAHNIKGEA